MTHANLISLQYAGEKAALRPIYEAVINAAIELGADVRIVPKRQYVRLERLKQFATIAPASKHEIEVCLVLPRHEIDSRLAAVEGHSTPLTHKVCLKMVQQVDQQFIAWLRQAYEGA